MFLYFNIGYFKIWFISVTKAESSASLLQSLVHGPSEIILMHWFIINVGNTCAAYIIYLFGTCDTFLGLINK